MNDELTEKIFVQVADWCDSHSVSFGAGVELEEILHPLFESSPAKTIEAPKTGVDVGLSLKLNPRVYWHLSKKARTENLSIGQVIETLIVKHIHEV